MNHDCDRCPNGWTCKTSPGLGTLFELRGPDGMWCAVDYCPFCGVKATEYHFVKWINVEEQLPPQSAYVLVSVFDNRKGVEIHCSNIAERIGKKWFDGTTGEELNPKYGKVTHWMLMPDDP